MNPDFVLGVPGKLGGLLTFQLGAWAYGGGGVGGGGKPSLGPTTSPALAGGTLATLVGSLLQPPTKD